MLCIESLADLRRQIQGWKHQGLRVGMVPTMGNLHEGHLRLLEVAAGFCDRVVVSIFVNPTQFGPSEDYEAYPRTRDQDLALLAERGAAMAFLPSVDTMYPEGVSGGTRVHVPALEDRLCARGRPGHFMGVATVVTRLFNMVMPDVAVFGKKDYQQLMVIRHLVRDLSMPIDIHGVETVRDRTGLALSSRNGYLTDEQRVNASALRAMLGHLAERLVAGDGGFAAMEREGCVFLEERGIQPDYVSICRREDLVSADAGDHALVILVAARVGTTRLIDNLEVDRLVQGPA